MLLAVAFSLLWKPILGEETRQSVRVELSVDGNEILYTADLQTTVEQVGSDGTFTLRSTASNVRTVVDGQDLDEEAGDRVSRQRFDKLGRRMDTDVDLDPLTSVMASLTEFVPPTSAKEFGDSWTHQVEMDPVSGVPLTFTDYKLTGEEGGRLRVDFTSKQVLTDGPPVTANGSFFLNRTTYAVEVFHGVAENVRLTPGEPPYHIRISLTPRT